MTTRNSGIPQARGTGIRSRESSPKDRHIPWLFVAFFGVVLAANGALVAVALESFTGLSTEGAYEKGLAYNRTLAEAVAQEKLGWALDADASALKRGAGRLGVTLRGRDGAALTGAHVAARFIRPTVAGADTQTKLMETAAGYYEAEPALPLAGQWDMVVIASHDGASYQTTRRIVIPE